MRRANDPDDWSDVASFRSEPVEPADGPDRNVHSDHTHVHIIPTAGAVGRYHGAHEPGVRSGRTYGTNVGEAAPRLAQGRARLVMSLMLLLMIGALALWVALGGEGTPPPSEMTPSAPPVSPGHVVGNGPYFG